MSDTSAVIYIENASVILGKLTILDTISLTVNLGEFIYLVGRTGSGKSTLLKLIYGDCESEKGRIQVGPYTVQKLGKKKIHLLRRKMGIVFQDFQLLPDRTVNDNILFALKASGWKDKSKIKQRLNDVLIRVGMTGKGKSFPHQLSGGEQQRISIARALINDPLLLIADEPTGNLDPDASMQIMELLKNINKGGTAILMATHEYPLIQKYPAKVVQVKDHKLIEFDSSEKFLEQSSYLKEGNTK